VSAWKSDLTDKKRAKIAATIADPSTQPELFEEGWEEALAREEALLSSCESMSACARVMGPALTGDVLIAESVLVDAS
jgi:hypothetical protein